MADGDTPADRNEVPGEEVEPHAIAMAVAAPFEILQCWECMVAVSNALQAAGFACERLRLQSPSADPPACFIVSDRACRTSITQNGRHYGVLFDGRVYDNLTPTGLPLAEWLADLHCTSTLALTRTPFPGV